MNRRGFLQMVGAALVVPHIPERVYSFIRRSDNAYLQSLIDGSPGRRVAIAGEFELDGPLVVPPYTYLDLRHASFKMMEHTDFIDLRRSRESTVHGGIFDYCNAPLPRIIDADGNEPSTVVGRDLAWTGGPFLGTRFRY